MISIKRRFFELPILELLLRAKTIWLHWLQMGLLVPHKSLQRLLLMRKVFKFQYEAFFNRDKYCHVTSCLHLIESSCVFSGLTVTEIFTPGQTSSTQVSSSQPTILVRPSAVYINSCVLLFGGKIFGTESFNSNVYKFDLTSYLWSTLETALQNSFGLMPSDIMLDYFSEIGK